MLRFHFCFEIFFIKNNIGYYSILFINAVVTNKIYQEILLIRLFDTLSISKEPIYFLHFLLSH